MASSCLYEKGISDLIQSKKYFHGALNTPSKTGKGAGLGFVVVRILVCADREGSHWFEFRESCVTCALIGSDLELGMQRAQWES